MPCYGYGNRGEEQLQPQLIASNNKYAVAHRGPQQRHRYHLGTYGYSSTLAEVTYILTKEPMI